MKIKWGALMVDGRGKIGGQVASKNRSGAYMRNKVTPSNPRTASQQANRSLLGSLSASWSALTASARASFNGAVDAWSKTNIFGDSIKPTGKNLFTALNKNLNSIGLQTILVAPEKVEMPIIGLETAVVDISNQQVTLSYNGNLDGYYMVIGATPPLTLGTIFTKGKFRRIYAPFAENFDQGVLYQAYVARYGEPVAGQNISFEVKVIASNGQMSVPETVKALVQA